MSENRYTKNGEWARREGELILVGLSKSQVDELGDITFVELPSVGTSLKAGQTVAAIEAVKAAADYFSPLDGVVAQTNVLLKDRPEIINESPEEEGWIFSLKDVSAEAWGQLLSGQQYADWLNTRT